MQLKTEFEETLSYNLSMNCKKQTLPTFIGVTWLLDSKTCVQRSSSKEHTHSETLCFSVRRGEGVFLSRHFDSPQQECQTDLPFYRAFVVYLLLKALWATFTHSPTRSYSDGKGPHCSVKSALWNFSAQPSTHTFTHWRSSRHEQGTGVTNNTDDGPVPLGCATKPCQSVSMRNVIDYHCAQ